MSRTTPDEFLSRAADLRAAGTSWEAAADRLGFDADELQQLTRDAGPDYRKLLRDARQSVVDDGFHETMFTLRKLPRTGDDKAADCLARIWVTTRRHRLRFAAAGRKEPPPPPTSQGGRGVFGVHAAGRGARGDGPHLR